MRLIPTFASTTALALLGLALTPAAQACSSCGCTLNADWATQGLQSPGGGHIGLRVDYFRQEQLRRGTGSVSRGSIDLPSDEEIQVSTANRQATLSIDQALGTDWAVSGDIPVINRPHATIAEGDTDISRSHTQGLGDVRLLARWQQVSEERDWGLQLGLKLPTGSTHTTFSSGPQAGEALDRGLQAGTGSTDLLLGAFRFGAIGTQLNWFSQALLQLPISSRAGFKPGAGLTLSSGLRWQGGGTWQPQLQLNLRHEGRESGDQADRDNSGATLLYLSPGSTLRLGERLQAFGFVQLPVYQRVNGLQLEPRWSASIGLQARY